MNSIEGLGWSLVGIYIPIYLFSIGYKWEQVFIYYIIQNTAILFSSFVVASLGRLYSLRKILLIRFPLLFIFLVLLYFLETKNIPIYLVATFDGLQSGLFWLPMHILFSKFADAKNIENDTSKLSAVPQFIGMFGPLLGALISIKYGFSFLFVIGFVFFILAFIPIVLARVEKIEYEFNLKSSIDYYKKYPKYFYSELLNNMAEEIEGVIWPIFVYINVSNIASVGIVGTALAVSSALFTLYIGRISKKDNRKKMIFVGVLLMMMIWILRFILEGELIYYILTVLSGISYVVFSVSYYARIYKIGKKEESVMFFAFREIPVWLARILVFLLAIFFVDNLEYLFLLAGATYIYFLFWEKIRGNI